MAKSTRQAAQPRLKVGKLLELVVHDESFKDNPDEPVLYFVRLAEQEAREGGCEVFLAVDAEETRLEEDSPFLLVQRRDGTLRTTTNWPFTAKGKSAEVEVVRSLR